MKRLALFSALVIYSFSWLITPWTGAVALFVAGAAFFWILFFSSLIVEVKRREVIVAFALSLPFALAALSTEAFIWYGLGPLAALIWLIYLAKRTYGSLLKGILLVLGTIWLHVVMLVAIDVITGGVLTKAYDLGLNPLQRWNIPVIALADATTLFVAAEIVKWLFKLWR
ncbi:MAG: hypothetical protein QXK11_03245 [Pyrobaculum sp.]|uniref:hypothetical protein n=1 Tax=Pyrobaculum sp. TaxID=2004705 RepID=UPI003171AFF0